MSPKLCRGRGAMTRQRVNLCILPLGQRTIDPDGRRLRVGRAYRKGQAVEWGHKKGGARSLPRCDPSHWRVIGPRIKDVDCPLPARHVNALAFAIEEDVVNVTTGVAFGNGGSRLHVAHA